MKELEGQLTFFMLDVMPEMKKPARKKKSRLESFVHEYHGYGIADAGSVTSQDFKTFAKRLKTVIIEMCGKIGAELVTYSVGHYYISLFLRMEEWYVYVSYEVPRGEVPINLYESGVDGFLYRAAKNEKDYKGCRNHFCSLLHLEECVTRLLEQKKNSKDGEMI